MPKAPIDKGSHEPRAATGPLTQADMDLLEANMRLSHALTELKRHQQKIIQQARLNALGQMTGGITHDFNNALMPILGFSEFLIGNPVLLDNKEETLGILKDIHSAARHAADMIRRLSNFYRPADENDRTMVNMAELVQEVVATTRPRWHSDMGVKGVSIRFLLEVDGKATLCCNETQIREVLTNLVLNAVDAMNQGGKITIRGRVENPWFILTISDTGQGMSPETQQRCFEPFYTTKGKDGTGIGLSMVYGIVRAHNGHIDVESEKGVGTTFTIRLSLDEARLCKADLCHRALPDTRELRILIVDDEPWSRNFMARHLRHCGHIVEDTESGEDGLSIFEKEDFDVVVTDRAMPDMSGDSLALRMKKMRPATPIVMVSGFGDIMNATGEMPRGVDALLGKPVTRTELSGAIAKAMGCVAAS